MSDNSLSRHVPEKRQGHCFGKFELISVWTFFKRTQFHEKEASKMTADHKIDGRPQMFCTS